MKLRHYLLSAILLIAFSSGFAQTADDNVANPKKFYVRAFASYGFLTGGSFKAPAGQSTVLQNGITTNSFSAQSKGLGEGLRFGGGFGLVVSKIINIGIDAEYLSGTKLTSATSAHLYDSIQVNAPTNVNNAADSTVSVENYALSSAILSIIPSITFKAISTQKYYIYTRVGVIIGIPMKLDVSDTTHSLHTVGLPATAPNGYNYYTEVASNSTFKYKCNPGIGYQAALGIAFKATNSLRFYFEVVSNSLTLKPVEYEQTYHTGTTTNKYKNGTDLTTIEHNRNIQQFKDSGTSTFTTSGPAGNTVTYYQSPSIHMAVNSLNIGAGLIFNF